MAAHPTLAEIVLSGLGEPVEPFGWAGFLVLCAMVAALSAYLAFEYGVGRLVDRLIAGIRNDHRRSRRPPADKS
jgi:hypothetical protein